MDGEGDLQRSRVRRDVLCMRVLFANGIVLASRRYSENAGRS